MLTYFLTAMNSLLRNHKSHIPLHLLGEKFPASYDNIYIFKKIKPIFEEKFCHVILENMIFVASGESLCHPQETSSKDYLIALSTLRSDSQEYFSVEHIIIVVVIILHTIILLYTKNLPTYGDILTES